MCALLVKRVWFDEIFQMCGEKKMPQEAKDLIIRSLEVILRQILQVLTYLYRYLSLKKSKVFATKFQRRSIKKQDVMLAISEFKSLQKIGFAIENGKNSDYHKVANIWLQRKKVSCGDWIWVDIF